TINTGEQCDGSNITNLCPDFDNFLGGYLECNADCTLNLSQCSTTDVCGDGFVNWSIEQCDDGNLTGLGCSDIDSFTGGTLTCTNDCLWNTSQCTGTPAGVCGDGAINPGEQCDWNGSNITNLCTQYDSFTGGFLTCTQNCTLNLSQCSTTSVCGDGFVNWSIGEQCDDGNLTGLGCSNIDSYTGGTLTCTNNCIWNVSQCTGLSPGFCGDGAINSEEQCDGSNITNICTDFDNFLGGNLICTNCTLNTSNCSLADADLPIVYLINPANNASFNIGNITFDVNATNGVNLSNCTLYTNISGTWQQNQTTPLSGIANSTQWNITDIPDGSYLWNAYCCDSAGNCAWNSTNFTFSIDTTPPNSTIITPVDQEMIGSNSIPYNVTGNATDNIAVASVDLNVTGPANLSAAATGTADWYYMWTPPIDGTYVLQSIAYDAASNQETDIENITVYVYTTSDLDNCTIIGNVTLIDSICINSTIDNSTKINSTIINSLVINSTNRNSTIVDSNETNSTIYNSLKFNCTITNSIINYSINYHCIIDDTYEYDSRMNYTRTSNSNITDDVIIIRSHINDSAVQNDSTVVNSTIVDSTIEDSNLTNVTAYNCTIIHSDISNTICNNSYMDDSDGDGWIIDPSNVTGSTCTAGPCVVVDSDVLYSTIATSSIYESLVDTSTLTDAIVNDSTVLDSTLTNTNVTNSTVDDSTLTDMDIRDITITETTADSSVIGNSTILRATISNSVINDSTKVDSTITSSTVLNSSNYGSTLSNVVETNSFLNDSAASNAVIYNSTIIDTSSSILGNTGINGIDTYNANITSNDIYSGNLTYLGDEYIVPNNITNITSPWPLINIYARCGNAVCENLNSQCGTTNNYPECYIDCGVCPPAPPPTPPTRRGVGGGRVSICGEQWNCTDWGICQPDGTETRYCWDLNKCDDLYNQRIVTYVKASVKPNTTRYCEFTGCSDGLLNWNETDIDCGGPYCPPCEELEIPFVFRKTIWETIVEYAAFKFFPAIGSPFVLLGRGAKAAYTGFKNFIVNTYWPFSKKTLLFVSNRIKENTPILWNAVKVASEKTWQGIKIAATATGSFVKDNAFIIGTIIAAILLALGSYELYTLTAPKVKKGIANLKQQTARRRRAAAQRQARAEAAQRREVARERARLTRLRKAKEKAAAEERAARAAAKRARKLRFKRRLEKAEETFIEPIVKAPGRIKKGLVTTGEAITTPFKKIPRKLRKTAEKTEEAVIEPIKDTQKAIKKGLTKTGKAISKTPAAIKEEIADLGEVIKHEYTDTKDKFKKGLAVTGKAIARPFRKTHRKVKEEAIETKEAITKGIKVRHVRVKDEMAKRKHIRATKEGIKEAKIKHIKTKQEYQKALTSYVVRSLKEGKSRADIQKEFIAKGWPKKFTEEYINRVADIAELKGKGLKF
ncbi:hypothetical protein KY332_00075, partial [Candidatus Woesearchaeota archaeon]|nr:hypothetical protein [Candidatus Woesearchaeota archaeon]